MPKAPLKQCRHPRCSKLSRESYCEEHAKKKKEEKIKKSRDYDKLRGTRSERGYTNKWARYSKSYRKRHPVCVECEKEGVVTMAQCVDHVVPVNGPNDPLFWDETNHQSLCNSHHSAKTAREDGGFGN